MPGETATKVGHGLAKVLRLKLNYRDPLGANDDPVTRGESTFTQGTTDTYAFVEEEPTSWDWIKDNTPSWHDAVHYVYSLFPFLHWITRYNTQWLIGDLVAGVTVGAVVVPQGMAYAKLAELKPEYGLYTSFMGVLIYWFFATSKDITIGPVAVMSTVVGQIVKKTQAKYPEIEAADLARCLAVIIGAIVTALGVFRLGFIVDFIPLPAITAFMTGSAVNIISGQVTTLLGQTTKVNNKGFTYRIIIDTLKALPSSTVGSAMGLTALAMLYSIRFACTYSAKRWPHRARLFFFLSTLRTVFVILFYTMISAAVNLHRKDHPAFSILGHVPRGFQHAGAPKVDIDLIKKFATELPASVIVVLIEHIAISKSFGRVNNYTINPSQELVAIGVTNLLGPFLGAYPATGSFSRTAIKSKAGVRTPLAGVITAIVVLLAIYALPAVFFYIPQASLAGVIIHAVGDLITPPNVVYQFWRVSPLDVLIFFIGVIVTVFSSIENGVYCTICVSAALLLFRVAKARGNFLGRVRIHSVVGDHLLDDDGKYGTFGSDKKPLPDQSEVEQTGEEQEDGHVRRTTRTVFLPLDHADGTNPDIEPEQPYPGIFIYRFSEGLNYPNANHYTDELVQRIFKQTRRTNPFSYPTLGDRPWNDPGPRRGKAPESDTHLPTLKAIILDFASVNNVDVTAVQNLIDVRNQLDRYASPDTVQWHFAHLKNRWTKRALAAAGFGYPSVPKGEGFSRWKPIFSVAEIGGSASAASHAELEEQRRLRLASQTAAGNADVEANPESKNETKTPVQEISASNESDSNNASRNNSGTEEHPWKLHDQLAGSTAYQARRRVAVVEGINRPFFHIDLASALESAVANAEGVPRASLPETETDK